MSASRFEPLTVKLPRGWWPTAYCSNLYFHRDVTFNIVYVGGSGWRVRWSSYGGTQFTEWPVLVNLPGGPVLRWAAYAFNGEQSSELPNYFLPDVLRDAVLAKLTETNVGDRA